MKDARKNKITNLVLGERLNAAYRNNWFEIGLNGSLSYTFERDKINSQNNQEPYNFSYGGNLQFYTPWKMTITTNMTNQARRGYTERPLELNVRVMLLCSLKISFHSKLSDKAPFKKL